MSTKPEVEIWRTSVSVKIRKILGAELIKQQLLLLKTSQFKTVCKDDSGYITQLKQQKSKRLLVSALTMWRCAAQ